MVILYQQVRLLTELPNPKILFSSLLKILLSSFSFFVSLFKLNAKNVKLLTQTVNVSENKKVVDGKSALQCVTYENEWLCEAYMETDYSQLQQSDFEKVLRDYIAFQIQTSDMI